MTAMLPVTAGTVRQLIAGQASTDYRSVVAASGWILARVLHLRPNSGSIRRSRP